MGMDHKAYVFDYENFQNELAPILESALKANSNAGIMKFISDNFDELKDPYEGEPLADDWEDSLGNRDLQEYADYALTKYYDPGEYFGMSDHWHHTYDKLSAEQKTATLGVAFGTEPHLFDPGRQGSYFQSPQLVLTNVKLIEKALDSEKMDDIDLESLETYLSTLQEAADSKLGVYVTF